jgi:hypothetical protein
MIMKNLSSKDVVLIKRALKYTVKNGDLPEEHVRRADFLLKELDEDDSTMFYVSMITTMIKKDLFNDIDEIKALLKE